MQLKPTGIATRFAMAKKKDETKMVILLAAMLLKIKQERTKNITNIR